MPLPTTTTVTCTTKNYLKDRPLVPTVRSSFELSGECKRIPTPLEYFPQEVQVPSTHVDPLDTGRVEVSRDKYF